MKTRRHRLSRLRTQRGRGKEDFPHKKGVKYSKLKMTPEGEYSITKRKDGEVLLKHMKSVLGKLGDKHITDLTGNVGGDTILFGLHFKKVDSIELNPENYEALKNNVEVFDLPNVTLHQGDSTKLFTWNTDVLYADPPWGGPDYKLKDKLDLYLGDKRIDEFINEVQDKAKHIFLKVPRNYNFDRFPDARKFKIRGFYILLVK
jgi:RNA cap guanine-N2 methyltransferase